MTDPKPSPAWQGLRPTGKTLDNGQPEPGQPFVINCSQTNPRHCGDKDIPEAACPGLCDECANNFGLVLADIPLLLDDLDIAIAGQTRFVEHGTRNGNIDGSTASGTNQAITAYHRLSKALNNAADWPDGHPEHVAQTLLDHLHLIAHLPETRQHAIDISSAASRAHKVIDAPPDPFYYGDCPECGLPLLQERVHPDHPTPIRCRNGDYTASLEEHTRNQLAMSDNRWLTIDELAGAITNPQGQPYTREQVKGWIYREGLPREKRSRPRYVDGVLYPNEVWTYRLGDVRDYAMRLEAKRTPVTA